MLPTVLATQLPVFIGALGLAAVFSAEVSTCDAILFMLSTSLSKDLYKRFVQPGRRRSAACCYVARLAAVAGGIGGVILAIQLETVIGALASSTRCSSVSLFVPVSPACHAAARRRAGGAGVDGAGIVTLLVRAARAPTAAGYGLLNPNLLGLGAAALAFVLVWLAAGTG